MQIKSFIGGAALASAALVATACYGSPVGEGEGEVIGARAELVQKKREWLQNYDKHCGVCFVAFELCEKGSVDTADAANCEAALGACVRGGLINDADAGGSGQDASAANRDEDAVVAADAGVEPAPVNALDAGAALQPDVALDAGAALDPRALLDAGDALDGSAASEARGDAGQVFSPGTGDAGRRRRGAVDGSAPDGGELAQDSGLVVVEESTAQTDASTVDSGRGEGLQGDDAQGLGQRDAAASGAGQQSGGGQNPLAASVEACLDATQTCLDSDATLQGCVRALQECVRVALEQTFENLCTSQVAACRAERAPASVTNSIEKLCEQDLGFGVEAAK